VEAGLAKQNGELPILKRIRQRAAGMGSGLRLGIGDDCALLGVRTGEEVAVTTDLSIDGRHFRLDWHTAETVGHRTLARGLSDLAAMGARPVAAFVSLGLPRSLTVASGKTGARGKSWIDRFYDGLLGLAEEHGVPLAGGDLAESPVALADIVLVGAVPRGKALLRSGARVGDGIYVTGTLGGAAAGLVLLAERAKAGGKKGFGTSGVKIPARILAKMQAHLKPQPRIAQGMWLRRKGTASAAIDVSDGLSTDLTHLCEESGVAAEIDAALLPLGDGASLEQALNGGEDYELLFTARAGVRVPRVVAGVQVTRIGQVTRLRAGAAPVTMIAGGSTVPLEPRGWEHFS
jgi:thiamine-monophosphate kinase